MRPHKAPSQGALTRRTHKRSCPDLKHRATGCNVWPRPERSEGPASTVLPLCTARTRSAVRVPCPDLKHRATGCNVWPGPERSEGPAFGHGPRVTSADPKRSEGSVPGLGTHKAPSQGIGRELEASGVLPLCTARTRSAVRVPCPD